MTEEKERGMHLGHFARPENWPEFFYLNQL